MIYVAYITVIETLNNVRDVQEISKGFQKTACWLEISSLIPFAFQEKLVFFLNMNGHQKLKDLIYI